jgi:hypothetical protein
MAAGVAIASKLDRAKAKIRTFFLIFYTRRTHRVARWHGAMGCCCSTKEASDDKKSLLGEHANGDGYVGRCTNMCVPIAAAFSPEAAGETGVLQEDKAFREAVIEYERNRENSRDTGPRNERVDVKVRASATFDSVIEIASRQCGVLCSFT